MSNNGKSVLIIDDDENITRTLARILQRKGYLTDTAPTGAQAIVKAAAKCYSAALIDICLPDMKGTELLGKLDDHGCHMAKIIITGFPTMAPPGKAAADAYLLKPVRPQELLDVIALKTKP